MKFIYKNFNMPTIQEGATYKEQELIYKTEFMRFIQTAHLDSQTLLFAWQLYAKYDTARVFDNFPQYQGVVPAERATIENYLVPALLERKPLEVRSGEETLQEFTEALKDDRNPISTIQRGKPGSAIILPFALDTILDNGELPEKSWLLDVPSEKFDYARDFCKAMKEVGANPLMLGKYDMTD